MASSIQLLSLPQCIQRNSSCIEHGSSRIHDHALTTKNLIFSSKEIWIELALSCSHHVHLLSESRFLSATPWRWIQRRSLRRNPPSFAFNLRHLPIQPAAPSRSTYDTFPFNCDTSPFNLRDLPIRLPGPEPPTLSPKQGSIYMVYRPQHKLYICYSYI